MTMDLPISHTGTGARGAFFIEQDGKRVAELAYIRAGESLITVEHTEVDPNLGGRGIGRRLIDAAVAWARETHTKIKATCPYASAQLAKDPSFRDVLA
jgi:predicted GNAT family acetyltransferase